MTETIHDRLRIARKAAGYAEATEAAEARGWTVPTYLAHENGSRGIKTEVAETYASAYGVTLDWLVRGKGDGPRQRTPSPANDSAVTPKSETARVLELADQVIKVLDRRDLSTEERAELFDDVRGLVRRHQKPKP